MSQTIHSILALSIIFVCSSCALRNNPNSGSSASGTQENGAPTKVDTKNALSQVEMARKRVALRSILRTGDYYQARNDALRAIEYYETAHWEIKNEPNITFRLANAYYEIRAFKKAADLYLQIGISDLDEPSKKRVLSSLILDTERQDTKSIISTLAIRAETKEYYSLLVDCANTPENCVSSIETSASKDVHITDLQLALKNARETSGDEIFIQALLMWKLYEQGAFLAVNKLGGKILEKRPDYRVVMKMSGYAAYELANYKEAAYLLDRYYQMDPKDMEVANMLGIVNFLKEDYATSNLYFNAAVLGGYTPKVELERRLIYNYVLLGDSVWAFKVFNHLLASPEAQPEDFQIALYMSDQSKELIQFKTWSMQALTMFPNDATIRVFVSKSFAYSGDITDSEVALEWALALDPTNALGLIEQAKKYIAKGEYQSARESIDKLLGTDRSTYYREQAQKLLDGLPKWVFSTGSSDEVTNSPLTP